MEENIITATSDPTEFISEPRLYELGFDMIKHAKDKRDEINKFFISLFSIFLSIIPFISHFTENTNMPFKYDTVTITIIIISILGISLSISWILMLRHTILLLRGAEHFVMYMERRHNRKLLTYIAEFLHWTNAPERVTILEMYISYAFLAAFTLMFVFSVGYLFF